MNSQSRSRVIGVALLAVTFLAGLIAGIAVEKKFSPHLKSQRMIYAVPVSSVLDGLDLTTAQRAQADSIVREREPRSGGVMREAAVRLEAISDSIDGSLRAILTSSQLARLDSLRGDQTLMLKRKTNDGKTTVVDTVFPRR